MAPQRSQRASTTRCWLPPLNDENTASGVAGATCEALQPRRRHRARSGAGAEPAPRGPRGRKRRKRHVLPQRPRRDRRLARRDRPARTRSPLRSPTAASAARPPRRPPPPCPAGPAWIRRRRWNRSSKPEPTRPVTPSTSERCRSSETPCRVADSEVADPGARPRRAAVGSRDRTPRAAVHDELGEAGDGRVPATGSVVTRRPSREHGDAIGELGAPRPGGASRTAPPRRGRAHVRIRSEQQLDIAGAQRHRRLVEHQDAAFPEAAFAAPAGSPPWPGAPA